MEENIELICLSKEVNLIKSIIPEAIK